MRKRPIPSGGREAMAEWEAALVRRLRGLPRHRASARLRRRILLGLAFLEEERGSRVKAKGAR